MLKNWRSHAEYQDFLSCNFGDLIRVNPEALQEYEKSISKLYLLNLDTLKPLLAPLYSNTGRPSELQPEIFRSFIMMNDLGYGITKWHDKLKANFALRTAIGVTKDNIPSIGSHYDFINRIIKFDEHASLKRIHRKPKDKYGKNKKMPPKHPNIVAKLVKKILDGRRLNNRPELLLQQIFANVCVKATADMGILGNTSHMDISGDGTCVKTGASPYGIKVCKCRENGIYNCTCERRFSDPNATWGWDSHNASWYYGYSGYFISTYNKTLKTDLPLYLRLVDAKRHDSITTVIALAEIRDLYPKFKFDTFISDSAADNYATYELLNEYDINAVIALNSTNKDHFTYPKHINVDEHGIPICMCGEKMVYWGLSLNDRCRLKWRCPLVMGKIDACDCLSKCSQSAYGRTIYTKPEWDLRLFTKIPRNSPLWKEKMAQRTSCERLNNRILNNYGLEQSKIRGRKRISFFATIAAFNIHLDAQLKLLKFSILSLLQNENAA